MDPNAFSPQQMAGQRLIVGFDGTELNADLHFAVEELKVGGIILFSRNLSTPDKIARLCESVQQLAADYGQPPLFIAIDQEGGKVARLKPPFTQFPGNPHMAGPADAIAFARITAQELAGIGVNMDMAPVLDVAPQNINSIMASRSFGSDPVHVATMGQAVIEELQQSGIMAVAKHYPGIGRTVLDSHLDLPDLAIPLEEMLTTDLLPFAAAIQIQVAGIMLSHIRYTAIDPLWPASLSPRVVQDMLRHRMGYQGVIMTDDLDMGAIKRHYDLSTVMGQILAADIDIALICHKGPDIAAAFNHLLDFYQHPETPAAQARRPLQRIMALKQRFLMPVS